MEQQLSNIKLKFFTDISHELRTPLTLISSPVSEVLEDQTISPSVREHLTVVHKNTERMLRLVNQILDFRKIQNKKMKVMVEQTELIAFLMKITENFRLIAEEKQIDFTFKADQEEVYIWIDRDKVEKIVFNLLSNAFKYTLPGKTVKITVQKSDQHIRISIIDEGIGIAPDKIGSLFKRFETLSKNNNILQPSSGIGLSLVKELVDMHHGNIEVKSQPGTGSEFSVTLPLEREVFEKDAQAELILADSSDNTEYITTTVDNGIAESENSSEEDFLSILIVEDNRELRSLLRNILSKKYTILEAANGEEGLKLASEAIPDMIISDVMMPVMDGLEMIKRIKENKDICYVPIILLSAKASLDDRITALEQGIDDYITKPFNILEVKARIKAIIRRSSKKNQKESDGLEVYGSLKVDSMGKRVYIKDKEISLTTREYELLSLLVRNPRKIYSRDNLLHEVWGAAYPGDARTVDVHIRRLREKIEETPSDPAFIHTKWGVGYYFENKE